MAKNKERRGKRSYASMSTEEATALLNKRLKDAAATAVADQVKQQRAQHARRIGFAFRDLGECGHFAMTTIDEEED